MIERVLDLHIHSRYSRACSPLLELPNIERACVKKGIDIVVTGDFTHPAWFAHLEKNLEEIDKSGLCRLRGSKTGVRFILGTEISLVYKHKDKTRRLHILIFAPSLEVVKKFNGELEKRGVNIKSDGRPIMGLSAVEIMKICNGIDKRMVVIPAHAWTPWFAVFGSKSGYDSLQDCFEGYTDQIFAIETGLSSDPIMNRRLSQLDNIVLVSNSDAHSLEKLGREANVLAFKDEKEISYDGIFDIIKSGDKKRFLYTIEFYPEAGMYHVDGHKDCEVVMMPKETKKAKCICPKCKKKLTVGVLHRVDDLADREENKIPDKFIPYKYIVPLREIIAEIMEVGAGSKKVAAEYERMLGIFGPEFKILLKIGIDELEKESKLVAKAIKNMREGKVVAHPGYDGVYGRIEVLPGPKVQTRQVAML